MVQNHSVGPPIWDSCDGRPGTQGWSYVINAYQFTSARCPATVVAGGCHQLITPAPRFNRLLAPCPRRAQTAGDSRPIAGSSGGPRPAQSSGPPRWIARIKLVPKLTVRVRFPSPAPHAKSVAGTATSTVSLKPVNAHSRPKTAPVQLRVPLAIVASAPWRLSVAKLTVRLQFPGAPLLQELDGRSAGIPERVCADPHCGA